jgi:diguanylate cyclase (GGDEF)-like protein
VFAGAKAGGPTPADWATLHRSFLPDGAPLPSEEGALLRGLRGLDTNGLVFTLQRPGAAAPIWVEASGRPVRDAEGQVVGSVAVYRDITERKRQADASVRNEQIYRAIVQHLPGSAVFMIDRDLRYVSADGPILPEILQRTQLDGLVGKLVADVVAPVNREAVLATYRAALRGESQKVPIERDGRHFEVSTVPIYEGDAITHALVFSRDVTDLRREAAELARARDSLARQRSMLYTMIAHIEDAVALLDAGRNTILANQAYADLLGVPLGDVIGMSRDQFAQILVPMLEDPSTFTAQFVSRATSPVEEFVFARPHRRVMRRTWTPLRVLDSDGYFVTWHDVTAERDLLRERERQLLVDALTGIPNRRAAEAAMRTEQERSKRLGSPLCVALFDIDQFKAINDTHGHGVGDDVLRMVAGALAGEARLTDTVARWGGEEFVAVLNVPLEGARAFCERARHAVETVVATPVERVTISAGVAEMGPSESPADALARADAKLYEAKNAGRNRVQS